MSIKSTLFTAAMALAAYEQPSYAAQIKHEVIILDGSDSVPLLVNQAIANMAANTVRSRISALSPGDIVWLRSLGDAGEANPLIRLNVTLSRKAKYRPQRMAKAVGSLVSSLPARVQSGQIDTQTSTNIIGFLERLAPSLDCHAKVTHLTLFTDGIEWSNRLRGQDLLSGKVDLPPPSGPIFEGCHVEMRGLGQLTRSLGTDSRWYPLLRNKWSAFFKAAGARSFKAYAAYD